MATNLLKIIRHVTGTGNPTTGDRLVREVRTFGINTQYTNKTDGSVWIRKAVNAVAADFETQEPGEGGGGSDPGYLSYVALLTQSGTAAPVANVIKNDFDGIELEWARGGAGNYDLYDNTTQDGIFNPAKTVVFVTSPFETSLLSAYPDSSSVRVTTTEATDGVRYDGYMGNGVSIEIRVYP